MNKHIWLLLGGMSLVLVNATTIIDDRSFDFLSFFLLGVWLILTANKLYE